MAVARVGYGDDSNIGAYALLNNRYGVVPDTADDQFYSACKTAVGNWFNFVTTSIADTPFIGQKCVGNSKGLILPYGTTRKEYNEYQKLGYTGVRVFPMVGGGPPDLKSRVACNDCFAICDPTLDAATVNFIQNVLEVIIINRSIGGNNNVGSCCVLTNHGGLVGPGVSAEEVEELSNLLRIPIVSGTVNGGQECIADGLVVNDWAGICGPNTTLEEISVIKKLFPPPLPLPLPLPPAAAVAVSV